MRKIIAIKDGQLLVEVTGLFTSKKGLFNHVHYEVWFDREKFEQCITSEIIGDCFYVYVTEIFSTDENVVIELFFKKKFFNAE